MPLDSSGWQCACTNTESTLHQLSPYIGKLKSSIASCLIQTYTQEGNVILDPFSGSGTISLECLISNRNVIAADISFYAYILTMAKLFPPASINIATQKANNYLLEIENNNDRRRGVYAPPWVRSFFHERTLQQTINMFGLLLNDKQYFLLSCMLGILHHQRTGFLSYPASHLVPYLRNNKFPKKDYPHMYEYRAIRPRLLNKIARAYKRFPTFSNNCKAECRLSDINSLEIDNGSIDAIITSPPYMNALDYARDNRLRLWFLGVENYDKIDKSINSKISFLNILKNLYLLALSSLKPKGLCIIILGDLKRSKTNIHPLDRIFNIFLNDSDNFKLIDLIKDKIPDVRRSRKHLRGTKNEWVIVFEKS